MNLKMQEALGSIAYQVHKQYKLSASKWFAFISIVKKSRSLDFRQNDLTKPG